MQQRVIEVFFQMHPAATLTFVGNAPPVIVGDRAHAVQGILDHMRAHEIPSEHLPDLLLRRLRGSWWAREITPDEGGGDGR